jgi:tetratricopeptide (TPR) repeat protein
MADRFQGAPSMRNPAIAVLILFAAGGPTALSRAATPPDARSETDESAIQALEASIRGAGSQEKRAELRVFLAKLLTEHAAANTLSAKPDLERAVELYREAASEGTADVKLLASNNCAAALVELNRPSEALTLLESIEGSLRAPQYRIQRSRTAYNRGSAYESLGQPAQAIGAYLESNRLDPLFDPAAEAASRLAEAIAPAEGLSFELTLVRSLISQGNRKRANQELSLAFTRQTWLDLPSASGLLVELLNFLTIFRPTLSEANEILATLAKVKSLPNPSLVEKSGEVLAAMREDFPFFSRPEAAIDFFSGWSSPDLDAATFARYLEFVANWRMERRQFRSALSLLVSASALDPRNPRLAAQQVDLGLNELSGDESANAVMRRIARTWNESGIKGQPASPDLFRLETLLGEYYAKLGQLGPTSSSEGAIVVWKRALAVHEQLRRRDSEKTSAAPGLLARLGEASEAVGEQAEAKTFYLAAAEGLSRLTQSKEAATWRARAEGITLGQTPHPQAALASWTGWITDDKCGAKGAKAEHKACAEKCFAEGHKLVFYNNADKKLYMLDDKQHLAMQHLGYEVKVGGTVNGAAIEVLSIEPSQKN